MSNQNYFLSTNIQGDFNDSTIDNSGYGSLSVAEKNQTYFTYFSSVGSTNPEIIDQTAYFIKYIIDAQGNVVTPQPNSIDVLNLIQNFEPGKIVNVTNLEGTTLFSSLLGSKTITDFGRIEVVAVSQIGYNVVDYTSSLIFAPPTTTYGSYDYSFLAKVADLLILTGSFTSSFTPIPYSNETSDVNSNYDTSTYSYGIPNNTPDYSNNIRFIATLQIAPAQFVPTAIPQNYYNIPTEVNLRIVTSSMSTPTVYDHVLTTSTTNVTGLSSIINVASDYINFFSGSRVRVEIITSYTTPNGGIGTISPPVVYPSNNSKFLLETTYGVATTASANYWTTGSANDRYVTASTQLTNLYNWGYFQRIPISSSLIGFNEIVSPFNPSSGDYIRFEYNPLKTFNIKNVTIDESSSNLVLDLGQQIQAGTNINNFVIYRLNPNAGNQLILNVPKPPGTTGQPLTGFIKPQHMSKELEDNFTTIIQRLAAEGLLT
jgi:hypothetical protein